MDDGEVESYESSSSATTLQRGRTGGTVITPQKMVISQTPYTIQSKEFSQPQICIIVFIFNYYFFY